MRVNLGIIVADFHKEISEEMLENAQKAAIENGFNIVDVVSVTGAFDVPLPLKRMLARNDVDAAIVLGAVVQGETAHDEIVVETASREIVNLSLKYDKPVGYGISGPRMTLDQAKARAREFSVRAVEAVKRLV